MLLVIVERMQAESSYTANQYGRLMLLSHVCLMCGLMCVNRQSTKECVYTFHMGV